MSKRWYQENRRDPWRRQAKSKGYRARSAYKLKQIQEKFEIIRKGDYVLDIGCHPGGWTQVAVEEVGEDGYVIGVDLLSTSPVEGATIIIGDITNPKTIEQINEEISKDRLKEIQKHLFNHQLEKNKSFEGKTIEVLVENKINGQKNLFGRNKYMSSVIVNADENNLGKLVSVKIERSNQNSLFGSINSKSVRAA